MASHGKTQGLSMEERDVDITHIHIAHGTTIIYFDEKATTGIKFCEGTLDS